MLLAPALAFAQPMSNNCRSPSASCVAGNMTANGTLTVTGATTLSSTLTVTGATNLRSTLSVGTSVVPVTALHVESQVSGSATGPSTWTTGYFQVGGSLAAGAGSNGLAMSYDTGTNTGYLYSLAPGSAYLPLEIRALSTAWTDNGANPAVVAKVDNTGKFFGSGTDSSGSPGNATINKPTGKSAIAAGASAAIISNTTVTANSSILLSPLGVDTACINLRVSAISAGVSFTVTGYSNANVITNCTAAQSFYWKVEDRL